MHPYPHNQAVRRIVNEDMQTPICPLKLSTIVDGYLYPNSNQKRYQAAIQLHNIENENFIKEIENIKYQENAVFSFQPVFIHNDRGEVLASEFSLMKFNAKEQPEIFEKKDGKVKKLTPQQELSPNINVSIIFDVVSYYDRKENNYKFTFPLKKICIYPETETNE